MILGKLFPVIRLKAFSRELGVMVYMVHSFLNKFDSWFFFMIFSFLKWHSLFSDKKNYYSKYMWQPSSWDYLVSHYGFVD